MGGQPLQIVFLHKLGKADVSLFLLHLQHLLHGRIGVAKFQLPVDEPAIDIGPVLPRTTVHDLQGYLLELLLVSALRLFGHQFLAVDVLLQRQQYLVGIDGFDEVVGYLASDGLVHDVLLLALGHHDDRHGGGYLLDALQGVESGESGHHLVEQHEVEVVLLTLLNGVRAVGHCYYFVAFLFQKEQVGLQQFHLIVSPK